MFTTATERRTAALLERFRTARTRHANYCITFFVRPSSTGYTLELRVWNARGSATGAVEHLGEYATEQDAEEDAAMLAEWQRQQGERRHVKREQDRRRKQVERAKVR